MLSKEEKKILHDFEKQAEKEAKLPESSGNFHGIAGIGIGVAGLFMPGLNALLGVTGFILAAEANRHGKRFLGITSGALAFVNMLAFFIFMAAWRFL